jgi:putative transposase
MPCERLSHSKWECKYHVVFISKCQKKKLYGKEWRILRPVFHELAWQRGIEIVDGHMVADHVHLLIKIPSKNAVAEGIGYIKSKKCNSGGAAVWCSGAKFQWGARGYGVLMVGV